MNDSKILTLTPLLQGFNSSMFCSMFSYHVSCLICVGCVYCI